MKHRTLSVAALGLISSIGLSSTVQAQEVLSGDTRLACEAILCLSSGFRPGECSPSLSRYFGINKKKLSDTIKARLNFLNLCPTASVDSNMESLVDAIANGAGRCDADYLNQSLAKTIEIKERGTKRWTSNGRFEIVWTAVSENYYCGEYEECRTREITVISNQKPGYCITYDGHGYTYQLGTVYVGDPMNGGRWQGAQ